MEDTAKKNPYRWMILLTVIMGTFLGRLDQTIVNLALPKIITDFSITVSAAGWIATAYILANAVFVPIWGKLGDTIGRKRVYLTGFGLFIVGSALAGLSWNLGSMIVFRVIQAIAGSADYPTAMAIIAFTFTEGKERAQALGIWSSSFAAAAVFGPLVGGPLIDNFGWRAVFLINIPVGVIGMIMAFIYVEESKIERKNVAFDWWGAMFLGGALSALVLVLDQGTDWGWLSANSLLCYLSVAVFTTVFYFIEKNHPEPIVDLKFFKNAVFMNTLANNFIVFMGLMGSIFLIPIFAQTFLGYNATQSGYLFIPMAIGLMFAAPIGGSLVGRVQPRYVIFASTLVAGLGMYLFSFIDVRSTAWDIMIPLFIMAFGLGFGMSQRTSAVASAVPQHEIGVASSVLALARNIAGAFGIALFGTLLNNVTNSNVLNIARNSVLYIHTQAATTQFITLIELKAQIDAYGVVYLTAAGLLLLGAFAALLLKVKEVKLDEPLIIEA
jgi:EmrB/QacA subfamily drug resistance transporter